MFILFCIKFELALFRYNKHNVWHNDLEDMKIYYPIRRISLFYQVLDNFDYFLEFL